MARGTTGKSVEINVDGEPVLISGAGGNVKITPVVADFGRADLNELRDKLNELIARS